MLTVNITVFIQSVIDVYYKRGFKLCWYYFFIIPLAHYLLMFSSCFVFLINGLKSRKSWLDISKTIQGLFTLAHFTRVIHNNGT